MHQASSKITEVSKRPWLRRTTELGLLNASPLKNVDVQREADQLSASSASAQALMEAICKLLHEQMLKYNWVGFYYVGRRGHPCFRSFPRARLTPHSRIPLNQGICGAAASSGKTVVVDDVSKDSRYLACSLETKSEIVVPIFVQAAVVGELDIDSHFPAAFTPEDRTWWNIAPIS